MSSTASTAPRTARTQRNARKVPRACDSCRAKRTRCSAINDPLGTPCSNCLESSTECTFVQEAPFERRRGYIRELEERNSKLQKLLNELNPGVDISSALGSPIQNEVHSGEPRGISSIPVSLLQGAISYGSSDESASGDEDLEEKWDGVAILPTAFNQLTLDSHYLGYHGNTSISGGLIVMAIKAGSVNWNLFKPVLDSALELGRPAQWESLTPLLSASIEFPPNDLISTLVDHYFSSINAYWPLLHRQFVEKGVAEGKHTVEAGFRTTLLLLCAIGARCSQDSRAFAVPGQIHSRGWHWFRQAYALRPSPVEPPTLSDVHFYVLAAQFLLDSSMARSSWVLISFGIKVAQHLGIHRRQAYKSPGSANEELWKRAFWVLVAMDRTISVHVGRSCSIQDEDFDLGLPVECDDEYWDPASLNEIFRQPRDQPSTIAYFNAYLRLQQIRAVALRTIYCINRSKVMLGFVGPHWEQNIVSELDSALNRWLESGIPEHLRWDPNRPPGIFFDQSLTLHACYHLTRIIIHQPFIMSNTAAPSLSLCVSSARACTHLIQNRLAQDPAAVQILQLPLFSSGLVILINMWKNKRQNRSSEERDIKLVERCIEAFGCFQEHWKSASMFSQILHYLLSQTSSTGQAAKRPRRESTSGEQLPSHLENNKRRATDSQSPSIDEAKQPISGSSISGLATNTDFWYPGAHVDPPTWTPPADLFGSSAMGDLFSGIGNFSFDLPLSQEHLFYNDIWAQYASDLPGDRTR